MLDELRELAGVASVLLGLNQNEANILADLVDVERVAPAEAEPTARQAAALRAALGVEEVVLHTHRFAVAATAQATTTVAGPYCEKPAKSTGAGDRFNTGYVAGVLLELPPEERLLLATAASGWFVREARSGNAAELATLLRADAWPDAS